MYNAIRRSKKIGLTQGGRVKDGRPREKWSRAFAQSTWEKLSSQGPIWRIIRENPSRDYFHPVTGTEVKAVLRRLPGDLTAPIRAVVLRRLPEIDERLGIDARLEHRCVILNSFPRDALMRFAHRPSAAEIRHYQPWCSNEWRECEGEWTLSWDREELKRYYAPADSIRVFPAWLDEAEKPVPIEPFLWRWPELEPLVLGSGQIVTLEVVGEMQRRTLI